MFIANKINIKLKSVTTFIFFINIFIDKHIKQNWLNSYILVCNFTQRYHKVFLEFIPGLFLRYWIVMKISSLYREQCISGHIFVSPISCGYLMCFWIFCVKQSLMKIVFTLEFFVTIFRILYNKLRSSTDICCKLYSSSNFSKWKMFCKRCFWLQFIKYFTLLKLVMFIFVWSYICWHLLLLFRKLVSIYSF